MNNSEILRSNSSNSIVSIKTSTKERIKDVLGFSIGGLLGYAVFPNKIIGTMIGLFGGYVWNILRK